MQVVLCFREDLEGCTAKPEGAACVLMCDTAVKSQPVIWEFPTLVAQCVGAQVSPPSARSSLPPVSPVYASILLQLLPFLPTTPEFPLLVRTRRSHSGNSTFKDLFERKLSQVPPCEQSQGKRFWQLGLSSSPPTLPRAPPGHCHLLLPPPQTCSLIPGQQQHLARLGCVWCFLATLAEAV